MRRTLQEECPEAIKVLRLENARAGYQQAGRPVWLGRQGAEGRGWGVRQGRSQGPARPGCVGRLASPAAARGLQGADSVTGGSAGLGRGAVLGEGAGACWVVTGMAWAGGVSGSALGESLEGRTLGTCGDILSP